ncbi:hypothetical protein [Roseibacillus ishigakijimensis]|uniref:hypothetical protein n=1 Tax=Roseibacillus ishigakijimensis TaxID=454146 RepID=UPI00367089BE
MLSLLTVLVGAKELALSYCLCQGALVVGGSSCEKVSPAPDSLSPCCAKDSPAKEPCDDCLVPVELEVADYWWSSDSVDCLPPTAVATTEAAFGGLAVPLAPALGQIYAAPLEPPPLAGKSVLLRHCRLRL